MISLDPYLIFNGNCAEAMRFYVETFDGTVETLLTYGASPVANECTADSAERVIHARLRCGERSIMASDCPLDQPSDGMRHISLCLSYDKVEEATRSSPSCVRMASCAWRWHRPSGPAPSPCWSTGMARRG